jgi:hypothetical protein
VERLEKINADLNRKQIQLAETNDSLSFQIIEVNEEKASIKAELNRRAVEIVTLTANYEATLNMYKHMC